jgi:hypothetical protein
MQEAVQSRLRACVASSSCASAGPMPLKIHANARLKLLATFLLVCAANVEGRGNQRIMMGMSLDLVHAGSICLALAANANRDPFLADIKIRKRNGNEEFRKGSRQVQVFPEHLTVTFLGGLRQCGPREEGRERPELRIDAEFMDSLQFDAYWKHGFDLARSSVKVMSKERSSYQLQDGDGLWTYELAVKSENVPLTDALVLFVRDAGGREIGRLSGKL